MDSEIQLNQAIRVPNISNCLGIGKELDKRDIWANGIDAHGFGDSLPTASNETEEGRARNRRTEFVILSN